MTVRELFEFFRRCDARAASLLRKSATLRERFHKTGDERSLNAFLAIEDELTRLQTELEGVLNREFGIE